MKNNHERSYIAKEMGDGRALSPRDTSLEELFGFCRRERPISPRAYPERIKFSCPGVAMGNLCTITLLFLSYLVLKCPVSQSILFMIDRKVQNESKSNYLFRRAFIFDEEHVWLHFL